MIKLIVSDIDGTLLEDGGNAVNPELFDVILQLRKQGIQFAAASGRPVSYTHLDVYKRQGQRYDKGGTDYGGIRL